MQNEHGFFFPQQNNIDLLKGNAKAIQNELDVTKNQLMNEIKGGCVRSIRGPDPAKIKEYQDRIAALEKMLEEAKLHSPKFKN